MSKIVEIINKPRIPLIPIDCVERDNYLWTVALFDIFSSLFHSWKSNLQNFKIDSRRDKCNSGHETIRNGNNRNSYARKHRQRLQLRWCFHRNMWWYFGKWDCWYFLLINSGHVIQNLDRWVFICVFFNRTWWWLCFWYVGYVFAHSTAYSRTHEGWVVSMPTTVWLFWTSKFAFPRILYELDSIATPLHRHNSVIPSTVIQSLWL